MWNKYGPMSLAVAVLLGLQSCGSFLRGGESVAATFVGGVADDRIAKSVNPRLHALEQVSEIQFKELEFSLEHLKIVEQHLGELKKLVHEMVENYEKTVEMHMEKHQETEGLIEIRIGKLEDRLSLLDKK